MDDGVITVTQNPVNMKVDFEVLLRRRNTATNLNVGTRTVHLSCQDVKGLYKILFEDGFIPKYFPSLEGEIAPIMLDEEGKVIKIEDAGNKEERRMKANQQRFQRRSIKDLAKMFMVPNRPAIAEKPATARKRKATPAIQGKNSSNDIGSNSPVKAKRKSKKAAKRIIKDSDEEEETEKRPVLVLYRFHSPMMMVMILNFN